MHIAEGLEESKVFSSGVEFDYDRIKTHISFMIKHVSTHNFKRLGSFLKIGVV